MFADLADHPLAVPEEWRREGWRLQPGVVPQLDQRRGALDPRHIDIVGAGFLEREPDELAAPLDLRPVV